MGKKSREKKERKEKGLQPPHRPHATLVQPLERFCLNVIRFGTYLALFTPLIVGGKYFFPFVGPKSIYFMGLVEIIFAAYLILLFLKPEYRPRLNILLIAIILFVAILILSSVFGEDFSRSFWSKYERMTGLLMWFHLLAFFVVLSSAFKKKEEWLKIFGVSVFAAVLISIMALFTKIDVNILGALGASSRGGATIGNSSFLGTYLLFNVFLVFYLLLKSTGGLRIYSGISLVIISLSLFLSDARAAIFSVLGGAILLFLFWVSITKRGKLRVFGISLLLIFIIGALILVYFVFQPDSSIYQKLVQMATKSRIAVWQGAWKGFLDHPWFGWGPENFELVFTKYFHPSLFLQEYGGEVWFDRAHNIFFDTIVASGIIGLIGYLGIFISAFYLLWKKFLKQKIGFWSAGIFSVILISYSVQNLTVFDMVNSYLMFFLILGFIGSIASRKEETMPSTTRIPPSQNISQRKINSLNPLVAIIILIFFGFSFFYFVIQPIRTDAYVIEALRSLNPTERVSSYKKTLETSPVGKYQIREIFADSAISFPQTEAAKEVTLEDFKKELDFVAEELEKSIKESPLDFRAHLKLGQVYNTYTQVNLPKIAEAEEVLIRTIELSPTNQQAYWSLAQTRLFQREFDQALSLAEKAVELEPRVAKSHFILVQIVIFKGDRNLAQEKAKEAIEIDPSWKPELEEILGEEIS
jgi:O-antigen ligase